MAVRHGNARGKSRTLRLCSSTIGAQLFLRFATFLLYSERVRLNSSPVTCIQPGGYFFLDVSDLGVAEQLELSCMHLELILNTCEVPAISHCSNSSKATGHRDIAWRATWRAHMISATKQQRKSRIESH